MTALETLREIVKVSDNPSEVQRLAREYLESREGFFEPAGRCDNCGESCDYCDERYETNAV